MIKIDKNEMEVTGTFIELLDNLQFLFYSTLKGEKSESESVNELFSFESYLRMMYTVASVSADDFLKLLKSNQKVLRDIQEGSFKLMYRDKIEGEDLND